MFPWTCLTESDQCFWESKVSRQHSIQLQDGGIDSQDTGWNLHFAFDTIPVDASNASNAVGFLHHFASVCRRWLVSQQMSLVAVLAHFDTLPWEDKSQIMVIITHNMWFAKNQSGLVSSNSHWQTFKRCWQTWQTAFVSCDKAIVLRWFMACKMFYGADVTILIRYYVAIYNLFICVAAWWYYSYSFTIRTSMYGTARLYVTW